MVWPTFGSRTAKEQNRTMGKAELAIQLYGKTKTVNRIHYRPTFKASFDKQQLIT